MKSIIQNKKECLICGTTRNLQLHHAIGGTGRRKLSDQDGLVVYLCLEHHTGNTGVHMNRETDLKVKRLAQQAYEKEHTREEFIKRYRRNYLD